MKIIGHRGAAGLAAENSLTAIRTARIIGVDAIEIDVRVTKDNKLVIFHDKDLKRLAGRVELISDLTQDELTSIKLKNGASIPTLDEIFEAAQDTPLVIEGKDTGWAKLLRDNLKNYKYMESLRVISFNDRELAEFGKLMPEVDLLVIRFNSFSALRLAAKYNFSGIAVFFWTLNPLVYKLALRRKLQVNFFSYSNLTIKIMYKIAHNLYPEASFTNNYPDRLITKV